MMTAWLPLTLLLPWLVPGWWRALRAREVKVLLPLGFTLLYVAFFTLSSGKRDVYIASALPGLALASAPLLPSLLRRHDVQWTLIGLVALLGVASGGAWVYLTLLDPVRGARLLQEGGIANTLPLLVLA